MFRFQAAALCLCAVPAVAQVCWTPQAIDLGPAGLDPSGPVSMEAIRFAGPNPIRLVAAGAFTRAGAFAVPGLAAWNGSSWSAIPGAPAGPYRQMRAFNSGSGPELYIAGLGALHRFNGSAWSVAPLPLVGGHQFGPPTSMTVLDPDGAGAAPAVLAGAFGEFDSISFFGFNGQTWSPLAASISTPPGLFGVRVQSFDPDGTGPSPLRLYTFANISYEYAPGQFLLRCQFYRFDGPAWSQLLDVGGSFGGFDDMQVYDSDGPGPQQPRLIITGGFDIPGASGWIASFNGSTWSSLGAGPGSQPRGMTIYDADGPGPGQPMLLVAAEGSSPSTIGLMRWNGSAWSPFTAGSTAGVRGPVLAFDEDGSGRPSLAVGAADAIAGLPIHNFAVWRQNHWAPAAPRPMGVIRALDFFNDGSGQRLFAVGGFSWIGLTRTYDIARWNGQSWDVFASGPEPTATIPGATATCTAVHNDGTGWALYIAGAFDRVAGQTMLNIARWNGSAWSRVGQSGLNGEVRALASHDPDGPGPLPPRLYAGGSFTTADGVPANHIAVWNGAAWSQPFGGTDAVVRALQSWDDGTGPALYVGGEPMRPAGLPISPIARLTAAGWQPMPIPGAGNGYFNSLCVFNDGAGQRLHAAGYVPLAGSERTAAMRLEPSGWVNLLDFNSQSEVGSAIRGIAPGASGTLYLGTTTRLLRRTGGMWTMSGSNQYAGERIWAITPPFDDGSGPAAFIAIGPYSNDPGSLGQVRRIPVCAGCYANCDASVAAPILNVNDFVCFLNRFAAADAYANCDGSTMPPALNVLDFTCFLNRFAAGCP